MKTDRQKLILELISGQDVGTQQQLLELLSARGVRCTQATLSRDIHALNLVKLPSPGGGVRYGVEPCPLYTPPRPRDSCAHPMPSYP